MRTNTSGQIPADIRAILDAEQAKLDAIVVSAHGFTRGELRAQFDYVANATNWKLPVLAVVRESDRLLTEEACSFFVGGPTTFSSCPIPGFLEVRNGGYYENVGA